MVGFHAVALTLAALRAAGELDWIRAETYESTAEGMLALAGGFTVA